MDFLNLLALEEFVGKSVVPGLFSAQLSFGPSAHVTCHMSHVTCHVSHVTCNMLRVTCQVSQVTCHMSCVRCQVSVFLDKDLELVGGGSVNNGAYPV